MALTRIGSWILGRIIEPIECIDCHRPLEKGERAWRSRSGSGMSYGRRVCERCMGLRQAARTASPVYREVAP